MRFAAIYAFTVLGPLVALLLVLQAGSRLDAPASVGGSWALEARGLERDQVRLELAQSGRVIELRWAGEVGRAQLTGAELRGRVGAWDLVARREHTTRLTGTLTRAQPPASVPFVAALERGPRGDGGH